MDNQVKTPPPEPPVIHPETPSKPQDHTELPPAPPPEPVQTTGALDSNGVPVPIPASTEGGSVITPGQKPAKPAQSPKPATAKPMLAITVAVVLFVVLSGVALFAYMQS